MTTANTGERLASLESAYEHLATKADVERLRQTRANAWQAWNPPMSTWQPKPTWNAYGPT